MDLFHNRQWCPGMLRLVLLLWNKGKAISLMHTLFSYQYWQRMPLMAVIVRSNRVKEFLRNYTSSPGLHCCICPTCKVVALWNAQAHAQTHVVLPARVPKQRLVRCVCLPVCVCVKERERERERERESVNELRGRLLGGTINLTSSRLPMCARRDSALECLTRSHNILAPFV